MFLFYLLPGFIEDGLQTWNLMFIFYAAIGTLVTYKREECLTIEYPVHSESSTTAGKFRFLALLKSGGNPAL